MEITILTEGLMCPHCEAHVKKALEAIEGVTEARADHVSGKVVLATSAPVSEAALRSAVEGAGYSFIKVL